MPKEKPVAPPGFVGAPVEVRLNPVVFAGAAEADPNDKPPVTPVGCVVVAPKDRPPPVLVGCDAPKLKPPVAGGALPNANPEVVAGAVFPPNENPPVEGWVGWAPNVKDMYVCKSYSYLATLSVFNAK